MNTSRSDLAALDRSSHTFRPERKSRYIPVQCREPKGSLSCSWVWPQSATLQSTASHPPSGLVFLISLTWNTNTLKMDSIEFNAYFNPNPQSFHYLGFGNDAGGPIPVSVKLQNDPRSFT